MFMVENSNIMEMKVSEAVFDDACSGWFFTKL